MTAGAASGWCRWDDDDLVVEVRVIPRARATGIAGVRQGRLLVRVEAPPTGGRANHAVAACLARACGVRAGAVSVESGERGRDKRVRIRSPQTLPATILD